MKTYRFVSVRITCVNITKRSIFAVYFFQLYMKTKKRIWLYCLKWRKMSKFHSHTNTFIVFYGETISFQHSFVFRHLDWRVMCVCAQFSACVRCMRESRCQTAFHPIGLRENHLSMVMFSIFEFVTGNCDGTGMKRLFGFCFGNWRTLFFFLFII